MNEIGATAMETSPVQGEGDYRYEISNDWAKVPPGMEWREVGAVAVDHQDRVYVFNRGPHPMMVFDREGNFLRSWGEGFFRRAHGAHFAPDEMLYLTDDENHAVHRCTLDGKVLATIGIPGRPAPYMSPGAVPSLHAHRPVAGRRPLRVRRLRQCPGAQVLARRQAAPLLGPARHGRGRVQPAS